MPFQKGNKFGRKSNRKGIPNKLNINIREKFHYVYENMDGRGSGDKAFLTWAQKNKNLYYTLFAKMAPKEAEIAAKTSEDFTKLLAQQDQETIINVEGRGINLQELLDSLVIPDENEMTLLEDKGQEVKQEVNYWNVV